MVLVFSVFSVHSFWAPNNYWLEDTQESSLNVNSSIFWDGSSDYYNISQFNDVFYNKTEVSDSFVNITGDTMTGDLYTPNFGSGNASIDNISVGIMEMKVQCDIMIT